MIVNDGELSVEIPDDFHQNAEEFKRNYQDLIDNFDQRLFHVVEKISIHFAI